MFLFDEDGVAVKNVKRLKRKLSSDQENLQQKSLCWYVYCKKKFIP